MDDRYFEVESARRSRLRTQRDNRSERESTKSSLAPSDIKVKRRFRQDLGDLGALAKSIEKRGLLHPVVVTSNGTLIAGQRRLEACKGLGWDEIPVHVVDMERVRRGELDENVHRKPFVPSVWVEIYRYHEPAARRKARKRQRSPGNFPEDERGQVRDKIGSYLGISGRTLEKAKEVVEAAEADPEYQDLVEEMDQTGKVDGVYKKLLARRRAQAATRPTREPFSVVVIDPPEGAWTRSIKEVLLDDLAAPDSVVCLWVRNADLADAFGLLRGWKLSYKTTLTWVKEKADRGEIVRDETEHCLIAFRGEPAVQTSSQGSVLRGAPGDGGSRPESFYRLVEAVFPGAKVDLFSRRHKDGWRAAHENGEAESELRPQEP